MLLCFFLDQICFKIGQCLNIWKIDEQVERAEVDDEEHDDFFILLNKINNMVNKEMDTLTAPEPFI